ncbi:MAG: exosortase/archaeosortase family protein [Chitinophagales bacterium]
MEKKKSLTDDPALMFVVKLVGSYALWKILHRLVQDTPWWLRFTKALGHQIALICAAVNNWFGLATTVDGINMWMGPAFYLGVKEHCLALPATFVFVLTILLMPGKPKQKLWFIPFGVGVLHFVNLMRFNVLSYLLVNFSKTFFEFTHSWVYLGIFYGIDMLLLMYWINHYAFQTKPPKESTAV